MNEKSKRVGILRGLKCRCPNCGETPLFKGFLTVRTPCDVCGIDNTKFLSDDLPPYLTIAVVGHIVIPAFIWTDYALVPALWLEAAIWLPATTLLSLVLLPRFKGASIGFAWSVDLIRSEYPQ